MTETQATALQQVEPPSRDLRSEPYRLFFPMAGVLAWVGVTHWFLLAIGASAEYRSIFHALVQIQGVMTCFALGFLFTFVPRRTGAARPSWVELLVAAAGPVGLSVCAWLERFMLSQLFWLATLGVLLQFAARRAFGSVAASRLPATFVWVPLSLAGSVIGALLTGAAAGGESWMWLHDVGRGLVLQGLFTGLAVGIGGLLFPFITRAEQPPPSFERHKRDVLHVGGWALFAGSFVLESLGPLPMAYALRAAVVAVAVIGPTRLWRRPSAAGVHRKLVWASAWCIPLGYALVAVFPAYRAAGLHVTFLGGFGLMAFAVSSHVVLSHSGEAGALERHRSALLVMASLFGIALIARALVNIDPLRYLLWLGVGSGAFLLATLAWGAVLVRYMGGVSAAPSPLVLPQASAYPRMNRQPTATAPATSATAHPEGDGALRRSTSASGRTASASGRLAAVSPQTTQKRQPGSRPRPRSAKTRS